MGSHLLANKASQNLVGAVSQLIRIPRYYAWFSACKLRYSEHLNRAFVRLTSTYFSVLNGQLGEAERAKPEITRAFLFSEPKLRHSRNSLKVK